MTRTPPKPPIVRRLETRRAEQPVSNRHRFGSDRGGLDLMFWGCVVVVIGLAYAILVWGGR